MPRRERARKESLKIDRKEIAERVANFFNADREARTEDMDRRLQLYAKFRMWSEGKDWPWDDASDAALPDMMTASLRVQDTLHNAVMSTRPSINANAFIKANTDKQDTIDSLIDTQMFVDQDGERIIGDLADQFVNEGVFTAFVPWIKESREVNDAQTFTPIPDNLEPFEYFRQIITQEFPEENFQALGDGWDFRSETKHVSFFTNKNGSVEMVTKEDMVVHDGPRVIVLEYEDVVYPPRSANLQIPGPFNPGGAPHVIIVQHPTVDEIKRMAKDGIYDLITDEELDELEDLSRDEDNEQTEKQKDVLEGTGDTITPVKAKSQKRLTRLLCFDTFDLDGDGVDEDVIWSVLLEKRIVLRAKFLTEVFPSNPPRRPFAESSFIPVRGRRAGISLLEMMEGLHDMMKQTFDQTVDAGTLANTPFGFYRPSGSMKPEAITLSPGELYPLNDPKRDVEFPTLQNSNQAFGINMLTILGQMEEKLTVVGDFQLGRVPAGKSSALRTASGMALLAGQGEARPERILRRFFMGLVDIWKMIHQLNQRFLPEEKQIRIVGVKDGNEDPYRTISGRGEIAGNYLFDFKANPFNTSKAALQEGLSALMETYVSEIAIQLGIIDGEGVYRLFRDFGKSFGQDPDQYISKPAGDILKRKLMAEEVLSLILNDQFPEGVPFESAVEHLTKLQEFRKMEQFGMMTPQQVEVFNAYMQSVSQRAAEELKRQQLAAAAGGTGGNGASPGRPPEQSPPSLDNAPVQGGELLDETLPSS